MLRVFISILTVGLMVACASDPEPQTQEPVEVAKDNSKPAPKPAETAPQPAQSKGEIAKDATIKVVIASGGKTYEGQVEELREVGSSALVEGAVTREPATQPQPETVEAKPQPIEAVPLAQDKPAPKPGGPDVQSQNYVLDDKVTEASKVTVTLYQVDVSFLNVRSGPSMEAPVVRTLKKGQVIQVIGQEGIWARMAEGAYTSTRYLKEVSTPDGGST